MKRLFATIVATLCGLWALSAQLTVVEAPETDALYRIPLKKGAVVMAEMLSPLECGMAQHLNLVVLGIKKGLKRGISLPIAKL